MEDQALSEKVLGVGVVSLQYLCISPLESCSSARIAREKDMCQCHRLQTCSSHNEHANIQLNMFFAILYLFVDCPGHIDVVWQMDVRDVAP